MTASPNTSRGKAVFITGSGSGIGRAVTEKLVANGYTVFGGAITDAEAASLRGELTGDFTPIVIDVRDERSVRDAAAQVAEQLGERPLAAVLNVAGIITNGPLVDLSTETFRQVLAVNVIGMHTVTREFLRFLQPGGRVINMSSASGSRTLPFTGAYSASKFGVEALSTAMRLEFAPLGIDVSVIAPGLINTPMAGQIRQELQTAPSLPEYREPLRRFLKGTEKSLRNGIPIERVVETIIGAVEDPEPEARYELHNNYLRDVVLMRILPVGIREKLVRRALRLTARGVS